MTTDFDFLESVKIAAKKLEQQQYYSREDEAKKKIPYPKTVVFYKRSDYTSIGFDDCLIKFAWNCSGLIGNESSIQYYHNAFVLSEYNHRIEIEAHGSKLLFTYAIVPKNTKTIQIYVDNVLLDEQNLGWIEIAIVNQTLVCPNVDIMIPDGQKLVWFIDYGLVENNQGHKIKFVANNKEIQIYLANKLSDWAEYFEIGS